MKRPSELARSHVIPVHVDCVACDMAQEIADELERWEELEANG